MRNTRGIVLAASVGILALPSLAPFAAAKADEIAFSAAQINSPTDYQAGIPVNLGMVFTIGSGINVDALGIYDLPDLTGPEQVGLYDASGTLLTSATVGLGDTASSGYLFHGITPLALAPGTYTVVAQVNDNPWAYGLSSEAAGINFQYDDYLYTSSLQFPTTPGGSGPAYFGPNFEFSAVPEPFTLSLFGAGLAGVTALRRRKNATA
jgi:hypothetical protein